MGERPYTNGSFFDILWIHGILSLNACGKVVTPVEGFSLMRMYPGISVKTEYVRPVPQRDRGLL